MQSMMWLFQERTISSWLVFYHYPDRATLKFSNLNVWLKISSFLETPHRLTHSAVQTWYEMIQYSLMGHWFNPKGKTLLCRVPKWPFHLSGVVGHGQVKQGEKTRLLCCSLIRPFTLDILSRSPSPQRSAWFTPLYFWALSAQGLP